MSTIERLEAQAKLMELEAAELERSAFNMKVAAHRVRKFRKAADLSRQAIRLRAVAKGQRTVSGRLARQSQGSVSVGDHKV